MVFPGGLPAAFTLLSWLSRFREEPDGVSVDLGGIEVGERIRIAHGRVFASPVPAGWQEPAVPVPARGGLPLSPPSGPLNIVFEGIEIEMAGLPQDLRDRIGSLLGEAGPLLGDVAFVLDEVEMEWAESGLRVNGVVRVFPGEIVVALDGVRVGWSGPRLLVEGTARVFQARRTPTPALREGVPPAGAPLLVEAPGPAPRLRSARSASSSATKP